MILLFFLFYEFYERPFVLYSEIKKLIKHDLINFKTLHDGFRTFLDRLLSLGKILFYCLTSFATLERSSLSSKLFQSRNTGRSKSPSPSSGST